MSIRLRLTLLYSVILALTLIAFSAILYLTQSRSSYDSITNNLTRQATNVTSPYNRLPGLQSAAPSGGATTRIFASPDPNLPDGTLMGRYTQIRNLDGVITGQTLDLSGAPLPLSAKGLQTLQGGSPWFETAQVQGEPVMIYSERFTTQGGVVGIVQVASPIAQTQHSLDALRLALATGCSFAILAAFLIGWTLAGIVLRPIHRITVTAQAIGAERNFGRRVEHVGPKDEVGQLAVTFNGMLAELESGYRNLERALESQRRFVADASHELRTPLTTVRGNIELLRHDPPMAPEENTEVLADTTDEVNRLIRLVNQLLVLARADAGLTLRHEDIPLQPLLEDVYRQAKLIGPHSLFLTEPEPDLHLWGDRDAIKQVLLILIDNAHVHTTPGTEIRLATATDADKVSITVSDTGQGIAPDVLPHLFERFYRGAVSRSGRSTGLGLAIAKELIEGQSGTIAVTSEPGKGTVFTITLPRAGGQAAPTPDQA